MFSFARPARLEPLLLAGVLIMAAINTATPQPPPPAENPLGFTPNEWELIRSAETLNRTFGLIARKVSPAVVHIKTLPIENKSTPTPPNEPRPDTGPTPTPPDAGDPKTAQGLGSGVIIDAVKGLILTNNHVIASADRNRRIEVALADGRRIPATIFATDPLTDLAIIEIKADNLTALRIANSDRVQVGDTVLAVGNPFGYDQSFSRGMVSALGRENLRITSRYGYEDFIQTDAAINPGNSGGPLVNLRGEIIGLNTALATNPLMRGSVGVGFAIPAKILKRVLPALRRGEPLVRGYLGVEIQDLQIQSDQLKDFWPLNPRGARIATVRPDTPAHQAGLQIDDIILTVNDAPFENANDLRWKIAMTPPGATIHLGFKRNGDTLTRQVTIAEQPSAFSAAAAREEQIPQDDVADFPDFGFTVRNLTKALAKQYNWDEKQTGVVLVNVLPESEAANIGFKEGHLIREVQGKRIDNVRTFTQTLAKYPFTKGVRFVLGSQTGNRWIYHKVQTPQPQAQSGPRP
jgi:serine protease Do